MKDTTQITKTFTFEAGHRLSDYVGKCSNLHGHTYHLEITVEGKLDKQGMVIDFGILKEVFKETVDLKFDHRFLMRRGDKLNEKIANALPDGDNSICWVPYNPTVEHIAKDIFFILKRRLLDRTGKTGIVLVKKIRLYETPTSYAEVT